MQGARKKRTFPKRMYTLIGITGLIFILVVGYSYYSSRRINLIYTSLINSAIEVKYLSAEAHIKLERFLTAGDLIYLDECWGHLDSASARINKILSERGMAIDIIFPLLNDDSWNQIVNMQNQLMEYRDAVRHRVEARNSRSEYDSLNSEFNYCYQQVLGTADSMREKLNEVMYLDLGNLKVANFFLIGINLLFMMIAVVLFYKYERYRAATIKTVEQANEELEREIKEHNLAEGALRESEQRLSRLIGNLPGVVYRCGHDDERTMRFISEGCFPITGYKPADFIENKTISYYKIIHPEDQKNVIEQVETAINKKRPFQLVYRIVTAPGFEKWVWEQGVGIYSDKGFVIAIEGFIIDITEQRTSESQLLLLSTALETADNGIVITDSEGNIVWANAAFAKMTGYSVGDVLGKNARILKSGKHTPIYYKELWDTINSGEVWRGELINQRKNGTFYDEEMTISPVKDTLGRVSHFIAIKQDITERKKANQALKESEERFRGLYENATIGIYQATLEGKILMANPTMVEMLGFDSFEQLYFFNFNKGYTNQEDRGKFIGILERESVIFGFESTWRRLDRNIIYIRESARAIKDKDNNIIYYEGTIEDITESKRAEYALIEAKEKAEKSDRLKTEFLAQMSHEIRTPINAILSFANLLKEEVENKVEEDLRDGFKIFDVEGKRIIRTIDLILNMAQLQTDTYVPSLQMVDLYSDVLVGAYDEYEPLAVEKNLQFLLIKKTDNAFVMADEYSVKQIISNLIDNAIKYTNSGKIEAVIERDEDERTIIRIEDTGIGISKEYLPNLFTMFTQEEHGYSRKFDGSGLGLALVKKYCELNRAEIDVKSEKGKGSTFTIIFPS